MTIRFVKTLSFLAILSGMLISFEGYSQNLQISGGNNFSVSLCSNGEVYAWGKNDAGQLGRNASNVAYGGASSSTPRILYRPVGNTINIRQVDAGSGNTGIALGCNGSVYTWGGNCGNGNIGNGSNGGSCSGSPTDGVNYFSAMQQVPGGEQGGATLTNISYINASTRTSFAVESGTGKVLAWGNNADGDLSLGTNGNGSNTYLPTYVLTAAGTPLTGIVMVEGTDYGGYALGSDGFVYSWGGNTNQDLGRTIAGDQYYAKRVKAWNYTLNDGSVVDLSNIVKMSGGDTHGLAIDASGNLWAWGGDWGPGQRGWGATSAAVPYATKVVAVGTPCAINQWKIGPWLTGVSEISAGQQHSIALMSDGRVVTFGNNSSGQLGIGNTTSSGCPVYVKTAAATDLTGIVSVSDGDLWSFALTSSGQVYVWGENGNGELGIPSNTTDQTYAYLNTAIPTSCGTASLLPCPVAGLGADVLKCPGSSVTLWAGDNGDTYEYTWYYSSSSGGPWTQIGAANQPYASGVGSHLTVTTPRYYRVVIHDNRTYVADKCGACVNSEDIINVVDRTPPLATSIAGTCGGNVCFNINSTGAIDNNAFDWYANQSTATKLNSSGTTNPFCTASSNLTLNGSNYEIWVQDKRTFASTVGPTAPPCTAPTGSSGGVGSVKYQQEFIAYDTATITSVQMYYRTYNTDPTPDQVRVRVYDNDPNKNSSSKDGVNNLVPAMVSNIVLLPRVSTTFQLVTLSNLGLVLPGQAGGIKYWLEVEHVVNNGNFGEFTCAATSYPYSDAIASTDVLVLKGSTESKQEVQQVNYNATTFNWNFTYTDGYPCGRFMLTAPNSTTACLPVEYLFFQGETKGTYNHLTWATGSETNSSHFEIMRSYDGVNWVKVGTVNAAGNSSNVISYEFNDPIVRSGEIYYRIVERDVDGHTTLSQTIVLNSAHTTDIIIRPNPSNGSFTIETNGGFGEATNLTILNAIGQSVYSSTDNFAQQHSKDFSLNGLSNGIYFVTLSDGINTNTEKLIIK